MQTAVILPTFDQFASFDEKYWALSNNSGNILFMHALARLVDCHILSPWDEEAWQGYDRFVTTELIWIREQDPAPPNLVRWLERVGDRPIIPISIGLQADRGDGDFHFHPDMLATVKEVASRGPVAARGAFTARILQQHGINDVHVVGCPSLYMIPLFQPSLDYLAQDTAPLSAVGNYSSFWGRMSPKDDAILRYLKEHCDGFIEQTALSIRDTDYDNAEVIAWIERQGHMFFDLESWIRHDRRHDFSLGLRFHANVAALLAGLRALFVTIDSRTTEMAEFFALPHIAKQDFPSELPLAELARLADYRAFSEGYRARVAGFLDFLALCGMRPSAAYRDSLDVFGFA